MPPVRTGVRNVSLALRNGSRLYVDTLNVLRGTGAGKQSNPDLAVCVTVENSYLLYAYAGEFNYGNTRSAPPEIAFRKARPACKRVSPKRKIHRHDTAAVDIGDERKDPLEHLLRELATGVDI